MRDGARSLLDGCALPGLHSLRSSTALIVYRLPSASLMPSVELVQSYFPAERVPMKPENLRRFGLITFGLPKSRLDKFLFELTDGFFQIDAFLQHFGDQLLQFLSHNTTL